MEKKLQSRQNESFLGCIARAYVDNFDDLSDFCFIFPNKRSRTFFLRALSWAKKSGALIAPRVMEITSFVEEIAELQRASRIDSLFRLYNIHCSHIKRAQSQKGNDTLIEFEKFRGWGETMLADFSEIDQYCVDAESLFHNVVAFKEISANFLTEEQIEVLERYFGYSPNREGINDFWRSVHAKNKKEPEKGLSPLKQNFISLWEKMFPLYEALNAELKRNGLATTGRVYRKALERLRQTKADQFPWKKVVFIGFNALSTSEALIFETLQKMNVGLPDLETRVDFFWDATGPVIMSKESEAGRFIKLNIKNFPSPTWAEPYLKAAERKAMPPDIRVIAAPSNSIQAKIAADHVAQLVDSNKESALKDAKIAVVLPDENLLLPLLYALPNALPEDSNNVNLTMGYPLRLTSIASFIHHLRRILASQTKKHNEYLFYHKDLKEFLAHPFARLMFGSHNIHKINDYLQRNHCFKISLSEITAIVPETHMIFDLPKDQNDLTQSISYLKNILLSIDAAMAKKTGNDDTPETLMKQNIDREHIAKYIEALHRLESAAEEHKINLSVQGVLYMTDRLLSGEQVTFAGEPLTGLQVMGLLETRALDFDHLIIPSLNDKIMPRKSHRVSFIPDALRSGYGLPRTNYQESLFSYYFYRMISRAKSVTLIYDARDGEGMRSGGESRYLMQLQYLYAKNKVQYQNYAFRADINFENRVEVLKSNQIMDRLNKYEVVDSKYNFSASMLRKYGECQLRFFYENVFGLNADTPVDNYIDNATQGNILHESMLHLYLPNEKDHNKVLPKGHIITAQDIDNLLNDTKKLREVVRNAVNSKFRHLKKEQLNTPLSGHAAMVAKIIVKQIQRILLHDRNLTPLKIVGCEISNTFQYRTPAGRTVNMTYAIDRIDIPNCDQEDAQIRIVDYKSGAPNVEAKSIDEIFNGEYKAKNFFQLMLYANLFNQAEGCDHNFALAIYSMNDSATSVTPKFARPVTQKNGTTKMASKPITGHKELNAEFMERFNQLIEDIYDPSLPFKPAEGEDHCRYCNIRELCTRPVAPTPTPNKSIAQ